MHSNVALDAAQNNITACIHGAASGDIAFQGHRRNIPAGCYRIVVQNITILRKRSHISACFYLTLSGDSTISDIPLLADRRGNIPPGFRIPAIIDNAFLNMRCHIPVFCGHIAKEANAINTAFPTNGYAIGLPGDNIALFRLNRSAS